MRSGTLLVSSNAVNVLSRIVSGIRLVLSEYVCTKCIWTNESAWWLSCASSGDGCACVSISVHICTYMYTCIFAYHSRYRHWFLSAYAHCMIATDLEWNQPIYICRAVLIALKSVLSSGHTFDSVMAMLLFSHSVLSDSLRPHGLQHGRLPCPSPSPRVCSNSGPFESVMPSNHLILSHPLLLLQSVFPSIRVFSNESTLCIRRPKSWSFRFSISPSNEYSGFISFKMDWLGLLVVQETLKSILQHHSSKASILWCSAFFMVQLSHITQWWAYNSELRDFVQCLRNRSPILSLSKTKAASSSSFCWCQSDNQEKSLLACEADILEGRVKRK